MIKTGYFLIKKITQKQYYQFYFFLSCIMLAHTSPGALEFDPEKIVPSWFFQDMSNIYQ